MNTFPLNFTNHMIFCAIGVVFFLFQFWRQGFKYQIMTAAAIGMTLLLYINDSTTWRYIVGVAEAVLIVAIFITMSAEKKKAEKNAEEKNKTSEETTSSEAVSTEENEVKKTDSGDNKEESIDG